VSLAAFDHQDLPFEKLVEELRPERHLSRSPLVQVLFQLLAFPHQGLTLRDLEVSRLPLSAGRVRFDLEMHMRQEAESLRGSVVYSTDLFDASTIERLLGHFVRMLEGIVADADQRISTLPLLSAAERQQLPVEWNDTAVAYPRDRCVHELFEEQAERTPDAVAVVCEGRHLTYRQLNERANQLAHHLGSQGVGPETLVGLCLERSLDLVVGILGILKAGGIYVPLDADHPPQRLQFILGNAAVEHLVTQKTSVDRLPPNGCRVMCMDMEDVKLDACGRLNPSVDIAADNLAYVMYTSGSTGTPKGVAISHKSVSNLLLGIRSVLAIGAGIRFLGIASPGFDISVAEILLPLVSGATTILVRKETAQDATALARTISASQPHIVQATPTSLLLLLDSGWQGSDSLTVVSTGEALPRPLAGRLLGACGSVRDFYGPTETTIWSTVEHITDVNVCGSIGRPIANTQVYVLDQRGQPVPSGVPGELHIGGAGLARGYLNRPQLTAEKFVPNPFSSEPGSRLYRTGDRCRWRADGHLEFLGRLDDQVKLRGFRIELEEIEAVLSQHPSVAQGVVVLREDRPGDKRLVAYCVAARSTALDVSTLTQHLRTKLPDYMVPGSFVALAALPLTTSGKVDRRALPPPDDSRPDLESRYVAPRTPTEELLAEIWQEVLQRKLIGVHDNFFALGGHSLLATRIVSRVQQKLHVELPLRAIFMGPTIEGLALLLLEQQAAAVAPDEIESLLRLLEGMPEERTLSESETMSAPPLPATEKRTAR
jgi:amino acid adenylation domain-containing protein